MKRCSKCGDSKSPDQFHRDHRNKDGRREICKGCRANQAKERYPSIRIHQLAKSAERRKKCASAEQIRHKFYYQANREAIQRKRAARRKKHIQAIRKYFSEYKKSRCQTSVEFKLAYNLRRRLSDAVRRSLRGVRVCSAVRDLGCTMDEFMKYISNQFQAGMSWGSYGKWHLDHIRPLASFDLTNREQMLAAVHYSNLQPLWAVDNIRKNSKWEAPKPCLVV